MGETDHDNISRGRKIDAVLYAARYRPKFILLLIVSGIFVAVLEGVGLTFIVPIVEVIQSDNPAANADGLAAVFVTLYQFLDVPFTLANVVSGVVIVMIFRYTSSFLYNWYRRKLRYSYQRYLEKLAFRNALDARMEYFDNEGSDEILNTIVTEAKSAARTIDMIVLLFNLMLLSLVYLAIAFWVSPLLTVLALGVLGAFTLVLRYVINPGYELGERVADANERRQEFAQAGMQGIRDIRIFNLQSEIYENFVAAVDQYTRNQIKLKRNETAISQFYNLAVAISVFALIYFGLVLANLSFGELGLFLFAMFQLGPKASGLNKRVYSIENGLPHLVRTQDFIEELDHVQERAEETYPVPSTVEEIDYDDVTFSYTGEEPALDEVNFSIQKGDFVAFVGQSGAGKSTIVSLLTRYYMPDKGEIRVNDTPLSEMNPADWRSQVAVVRQSPYIFNNTLRYNLTVGNRDASRHEIDRVCRIAKVDEFFDELPNGYESQLGDEGVKLSGGQKQRVALARALLKDAEVLILDEATSDLDSGLEKEVQRAIEEMDREYAMVTIAHRLSTVENADQIYVMEGGRIVESGSHSELISNSGKYKELYTIQSG